VLLLSPPCSTRFIIHTCRLPSAKPFVLAQRYVSNPLLINGCKFGIRLWLLVTGVDPFTCYLHRQGLVLFSTDRCGRDSASVLRLLVLQLLQSLLGVVPDAWLLMFRLQGPGR
jgi:hypothetical protein